MDGTTGVGGANKVMEQATAALENKGDERVGECAVQTGE